MRQKVQREFCLTVSCVLVTIKKFLSVDEDHRFNHAQNLVLFWMKSTLSRPHFCLDKSKKIYPSELAIVKIGSKRPSARNPIPAATKHKITGSISRTA